MNQTAAPPADFLRIQNKKSVRFRTFVRKKQDTTAFIRLVPQLDQDPRTAKEFLNKADEAQRRSELVRQAVISHEELNMELVEEEST